ncbi:unnamed protein product [Linum tenue]|uniref:Uncharacterized protein n=1 Tax=Linum tenue TaxID=586396 RepID=A0AAV0K6F5_9ROSI|nr:unnamed protein product [Linum tenue]
MAPHNRILKLLVRYTCEYEESGLWRCCIFIVSAVDCRMKSWIDIGNFRNPKKSGESVEGAASWQQDSGNSGHQGNHVTTAYLLQDASAVSVPAAELEMDRLKPMDELVELCLLGLSSMPILLSLSRLRKLTN